MELLHSLTRNSCWEYNCVVCDCVCKHRACWGWELLLLHASFVVILPPSLPDLIAQTRNSALYYVYVYYIHEHVYNTCIIHVNCTKDVLISTRANGGICTIVTTAGGSFFICSHAHPHTYAHSFTHMHTCTPTAEFVRLLRLQVVPSSFVLMHTHTHTQTFIHTHAHVAHNTNNTYIHTYPSQCYLHAHTHSFMFI